MSSYLQKSALYPPLIESTPSKNLGLIVVIPCYDEPDLIRSLKSLVECELPESDVEIIVIINAPETADEVLIHVNQKSYDDAMAFAKTQSSKNLNFHIFNISFPPKHAGVGLARKVGMDEAIRRFKHLPKDGIIICFDADSECDSNYLIEIEKAFLQNPKAPGAAIYFEHPLEGTQYQEDIYKGIIQYELHLRYYCNALRFAGHPFSFQTIGSSMAVRSNIYQAQGGMNKRKAGEDFYFLEKIIPLGNFIEINTTKVIPSPRPSHRVPFGTGKAILQWLDTKENTSYNLETFKDLKLVFESISDLYNTNNLKLIYEIYPQTFRNFMNETDFENSIKQIRANTTSEASFTNRFSKWFDLFMCLKFVHHCRDHFYPKAILSGSIMNLFSLLNVELLTESDKTLLFALRAYDRNYSKK